MALESVIPALATYVGKKVADRLFKERPNHLNISPASERIELALADHGRRIVNWSESVRIFKMPSAKDVDNDTIALTFSGTPRRFRATADQGRLHSEDELLNLAGHLMILGPPGAGKTTTIKRIIRTLLTTPPIGDFDSCQTPLLIRLRNLNRGEESKNPLLTTLARELGLVLKVTEERSKVSSTQSDGSIKEVEVVRRGPTMCEDQRIESIIPKVINEINPVLLLDGLDELNSSVRDAVEHDIELLLDNCGTFKIIATCRSGEYLRPIGYMTVVEVCSLQEAEILSLAIRWLGDRHANFIDKIRKPSLAQLSSRPLFLTHLLTVYDIEGNLPEQPFEVYEQIVMLMIREWDRERKIPRKSRYADFGPMKKLRFLASVAYHLTYGNRIKVFTGQDLKNIYGKIHASFGLPPDEAELVASELESHTGIIVEAGSRHYEFSHLTIQEYLCAQHLVTSPFPQKSIATFLKEYPAPLAIATALSADPAGWLAGILLHVSFYHATTDGAQDEQLDIFLNRLEVENPLFTNGEALGFCILALCFMHERSASSANRAKLLKYLDRLILNQSARRSFVEVITGNYAVEPAPQSLSHYSASRHDSNSNSQPAGYNLPYGLDLPQEGAIPRIWLEANFSNELLFNGKRITRRR